MTSLGNPSSLFWFDIGSSYRMRQEGVENPRVEHKNEITLFRALTGALNLQEH